MPTFRRQLKKHSRAVQHGIIKQMRKDILYLLKPKPKFLPKFIWMCLLRKILNLNPSDIKL